VLRLNIEMNRRTHPSPPLKVRERCAGLILPSLVREGMGMGAKRNSMKNKYILYRARELRKNPTEAEAFFWEKVRKRRFMGLRFNRQYILHFSDELNKNKHYIADFLCFEKKIIVEIDGGIHNYQKEYDLIREQDLKNMGFDVIRFTNEDVLNNWVSVNKRLKVFCENR